MSREEFDKLPSNGAVACPDCGSRKTEPFGGCGCPPSESGYGTKHINKWHHRCPEECMGHLREIEASVKDLEALMANGEIQDAAIRIICVGLPVGKGVCVAPNCECYEKHGKPIIAALWKLLTEAIAKAKEGKS